MMRMVIEVEQTSITIYCGAFETYLPRATERVQYLLLKTNNRVKPGIMSLAME